MIDLPDQISRWMGGLGRAGQWIFHRLFGVPPGEDEPGLVQLRWLRRCCLRFIGLVVVATVALVVIEGGQLGWFTVFTDLVLIGAAMFWIVRVNWRIWREKRWWRRGGRRR